MNALIALPIPSCARPRSRGFDLLFCNAESRSVIDASLAAQIPTLITTLGAEGARVETAGYQAQAPGFSVEAVDTTGAGDCFAAACLQARMVQRLDWPDALRFANRAAALSVQGYGPQAALPTLADVRTALAG